MSTTSEVALPISKKKFDPHRMLCGPETVNLACRALWRNEKFQKGGNVPKAEHTTLGGMLPGDMRREFVSRGLPAGIMHATGSDVVKLKILKDQIDNARPIPLFVGSGVGSWIVVWGYDDDGFFVYNVAKNAKRDERGLTKYSNKELLKLWRNRWFWRIIYGPFLYINLYGSLRSPTFR